MKWYTIETAPTNGESVLLYYGPKYYIMEGRCFPRDTGYNGGISYQWVAAVDMLDCEPSHWMPLPEAPAK